MISKVLIFFFLAFAALSINGQVIHTVAKDEDETIVLVLEEIEKLTTYIIEEVLLGKEYVMEEVQKIYGFAEMMISSTTDLFNGLTNGVTNSINDLATTATNNGQNPDSCGVGDNLEKIQAIPKPIITEVTICISTHRDQVTLELDEALGKFDEFFSIPSLLEEKLNKCGKHNLLCINKLLAETEAATSQLVAGILKIASTFARSLVKLSNDVVNCTSNVVEDAVEDIGTIADEVKTCLNQLVAIKK